MKSDSPLCPITAHPFASAPKPLTTEESAHLREVLKRYPAAVYQNACQYRETNDPQFLRPLLLGLITRFVEPDLRARLQDPPDHLGLIEDLGIDSLSLMEIVLLTEEVLAISITNDELRGLRTLGEIRQFIEAKRNEATQPETQEISRTG